MFDKSMWNPHMCKTHLICTSRVDSHFVHRKFANVELWRR